MLKQTQFFLSSFSFKKKKKEEGKRNDGVMAADGVCCGSPRMTYADSRKGCVKTSCGKGGPTSGSACPGSSCDPRAVGSVASGTRRLWGWCWSSSLQRWGLESWLLVYSTEPVPLKSWSFVTVAEGWWLLIDNSDKFQSSALYVTYCPFWNKTTKKCIQIANVVEESLKRKTKNLEAGCSVVEYHMQHSNITKLTIHYEQAEVQNCNQSSSFNVKH